MYITLGFLAAIDILLPKLKFPIDNQYVDIGYLYIIIILCFLIQFCPFYNRTLLRNSRYIKDQIRDNDIRKEKS